MIKVEKCKVEYNSEVSKWQIALKFEIDEQHYDDYHIESIDITNQNNYDDNWENIYTDSEEDKKTYDEGIYDGYPVDFIHIPDMDIGSDLMFIRIKLSVDDDFEGQLPCDSETTFILATFNVKNIYDRYVQHIKEINTCCDTPKAFIDFFLRYEAFKVAVITGNYTSAIKMYRYILGKDRKSNNIKSCGCGRIH